MNRNFIKILAVFAIISVVLAYDYEPDDYDDDSYYYESSDDELESDQTGYGQITRQCVQFVNVCVVTDRGQQKSYPRFKTEGRTGRCTVSLSSGKKLRGKISSACGAYTQQCCIQVEGGGYQCYPQFEDMGENYCLPSTSSQYGQYPYPTTQPVVVQPTYPTTPTVPGYPIYPYPTTPTPSYPVTTAPIVIVPPRIKKPPHRNPTKPGDKKDEEDKKEDETKEEDEKKETGERGRRPGRSSVAYNVPSSIFMNSFDDETEFQIYQEMTSFGFPEYGGFSISEMYIFDDKPKKKQHPTPHEHHDLLEEPIPPQPHTDHSDSSEASDKKQQPTTPPRETAEKNNDKGSKKN